MICYRCGSYTVDTDHACAVCGHLFAAHRRRTRNTTASTSGVGRTLPPLLPGEMLAARYAILGPAAPGASGWVMRARDERTGADVAAKVIAANLMQTDDDRGVFVRAVSRARCVEHEALARPLETGREGAFVYYTTAYVEGVTLRQRIDERRERGRAFGPEEVLPLIAQIAEVLDAAAPLTHHGALRPSNILLGAELSLATVTGLAHHGGLPRRPFIELLASLRQLDYLAPEARIEQGVMGGRADVHSLAVIATEMLVGSRLERDSDGWETMRHGLEARVVAVLRRGLSGVAANRFRSASDFVLALERQSD